MLGPPSRSSPAMILFNEGEPAEFWWLLIDGSIDLSGIWVARTPSSPGWTRPAAGPGGFRAWDEHGIYLATGRGAQPGRVFRLSADVLRDRFEELVPVRRPSDRRSVPHRSLDRVDRATAQFLDHPRDPGGRPGARAEQPGIGRHPGRRGAGQGCEPSLLDSLAWLAQNEITAAQFAALDGLRETCRSDRYVDPLDLSDREQALPAWLTRRKSTRPWQLASALTAAGADAGWCCRVAEVLPGADLEPALRWAPTRPRSSTLLAEVRESTGRVSELVAAVRSYSQLDRASRQRTRIVDGLENTLVMLGHKMHAVAGGARVTPPIVPEIEAFPGELNQVWTNLIDNAVDAMDGDGTLRVGTRLGGRAASWSRSATPARDCPPTCWPGRSSRSSPPRMSATGTGLGLDIARRIVVERHDGEIAIDSVPGGTDRPGDAAPRPAARARACRRPRRVRFDELSAHHRFIVSRAR